jgi:hypothetical protein
MKYLLCIIICLVACTDSGTSISYAPPSLVCKVTQTATNTIITCPDGSVASIASLIQPISPVGIVSACGEASSPWKEVLICLSNGDLLASFSQSASGQDTRLAIIPDGAYQNTDDSNCNFIVSSTHSMRTVSWNAGSNSYASWSAASQSCIINQ